MRRLPLPYFFLSSVKFIYSWNIPYQVQETLMYIFYRTWILSRIFLLRYSSFDETVDTVNLSVTINIYDSETAVHKCSIKNRIFKAFLNLQGNSIKNRIFKAFLNLQGNSIKNRIFKAFLNLQGNSRNGVRFLVSLQICNLN